MTQIVFGSVLIESDWNLKVISYQTIPEIMLY